MKRLKLSLFPRKHEARFHAFVKKTNRSIMITLFLFCSPIFFPVFGQTVTFSYDASGNVISKTVIQPVANIVCPTKTAYFLASVRTSVEGEKQNLQLIAVTQRKRMPYELRKQTVSEHANGSPKAIVASIGRKESKFNHSQPKITQP